VKTHDLAVSHKNAVETQKVGKSRSEEPADRSIEREEEKGTRQMRDPELFETSNSLCAYPLS